MPTRQTKKDSAEETPAEGAEPAAEEAAEEPAREDTKPTARAKEERKTMANRVDEAFELIKGMTILELRDLNKRIEEEFGVTAAAPGGWPPRPPPPAAPQQPPRPLRRRRRRSGPSFSRTWAPTRSTSSRRCGR